MLPVCWLLINNRSFCYRSTIVQGKTTFIKQVIDISCHSKSHKILLLHQNEISSYVHTVKQGIAKYLYMETPRSWCLPSCDISFFPGLFQSYTGYTTFDLAYKEKKKGRPLGLAQGDTLLSYPHSLEKTCLLSWRLGNVTFLCLQLEKGFLSFSCVLSTSYIYKKIHFHKMKSISMFLLHLTSYHINTKGVFLWTEWCSVNQICILKPYLSIWLFLKVEPLKS